MILCCPSCLHELFHVLEDGRICCAKCGQEIDVKRVKKEWILLAIH